MSQDPESQATTKAGGGWRRIFGRALALLILVTAAALIGRFGLRFWNDFQEYREAQRDSEDNAPIGYVGLALRRSYHARPAQFLREEDGKTLLFAARDEATGKDEHYDVTEADLKLDALSGGFGRDSTPGVDYPIFETASSERGLRLRQRQEFYAAVVEEGPTGYPADLLKKIEVVNDANGSKPFVIAFDRAANRAVAYARTLDGRTLTFGTTGYALGNSPDPATGNPVLYDRATGSLWLPGEQALTCVNGPLMGKALPVALPLEPTTWGEWSSRHPNTRVLMGSDRSKPIPTE